MPVRRLKLSLTMLNKIITMFFCISVIIVTNQVLPYSLLLLLLTKYKSQFSTKMGVKLVHRQFGKNVSSEGTVDYRG